VLIWRQPLVHQDFLFWVYASNVGKMCFIWCRPCCYVSQISFPCIASDPRHGRRACSALKMERVDQYMWPSSMIMIPAWWRCSGTNLRSCVRVVCDDVVAFFCKWPSIDARGAVPPSTAIASNFANLPRKHVAWLFEQCRCKGILPLCVVLVINDNPYGLIFSLSLYEGIFHRFYLLSMCWIQVWMPWR
jgi:hypothetical protein